MSRPILTCLAGSIVLAIAAAGCSSSGDEDRISNASPPAIAKKAPDLVAQEPASEPQPPVAEAEPLPVLELEPPVVDPQSLPGDSQAQSLAESGQATARPKVERHGPAPPSSDEPGMGVNPLRNTVPGPPMAGPPITRSPIVDPPAVVVRPHPGRHYDAAFDPIKENGPIFVGWTKPKLALVITGRQYGYIEPCGCAGLDRMKGGMSRRHSLFETLRKQKGWTVVGIDVGGIAQGYGRQAELKFHTMVEGMRKMGYSAVGLGTSDLRLPTGELAADAASIEGQPALFISANVGLFGFDAEMTAKTRIVEAAGMKLAITSVLGKKFQKEIRNDEIEMVDPETALRSVLPGLKQKADYLILLAHATMKESTELAAKFPEFDLVVTAGGAAEPPADSQWLNDHKTQLVEVGEKGMDAVVLAMFDDPKTPFRYQRVPLDSRFPVSADMKMLMSVYQDQLKNEWSTFATQKIAHPQAELGGKFVGSKKCETCHELSYDVWKKSGHAKAYNTLAKLDPPQTFDPQCISCHVVGWNGPEYFPYKSGFSSLQKTPHLVDVGCESCHGPGAAHVAAEQDGDLALQEKLQQALVITKAEAADPRSKKHNCFTCHDGDNSPDFDFETYWPDVEHYESE